MNDKAAVKAGAMMEDPGRSSWQKYRDLQYGPLPLSRVLYAELVIGLFGGLPGAAGLACRKLFYPALFASAGRGVVFGRHVVIRHPSKIRLGDGVVVDDHAVLDAKGNGNRGLDIGNRVFIGRNTIVYCKGGAITLGDRVNLGSNCQVFSSHSVSVGAGTVVGAYSYFLSGGEYDFNSSVPFSEQAGMETRGPLTIGANCWIGARVTVLDAACIGEHCVIGAGAVVVKPVPANSLAVGVPARVLRSIGPLQQGESR
jgi:acetyltransferase-like isoleucine patch superfamily enzyme